LKTHRTRERSGKETQNSGRNSRETANRKTKFHKEPRKGSAKRERKTKTIRKKQFRGEVKKPARVKRKDPEDTRETWDRGTKKRGVVRPGLRGNLKQKGGGGKEKKPHPKKKNGTRTYHSRKRQKNGNDPQPGKQKLLVQTIERVLEGRKREFRGGALQGPKYKRGHRKSKQRGEDRKFGKERSSHQAENKNGVAPTKKGQLAQEEGGELLGIKEG